MYISKTKFNPKNIRTICKANRFSTDEEIPFISIFEQYVLNKRNNPPPHFS